MSRDFRQIVKSQAGRLCIPLILFVLAMTLRLIYLQQSEHNDPSISGMLQFQDMHEYDVTAREYSAGNLSFRYRQSLFTSSFYPFVLAVFYRFSDNGPLSAKLFQAVISSLTVVLLYSAALHFMRKPFAVLCGMLFAFYGISIYYSAILLPDTIIVFFFTLFAWFGVKYREGNRVHAFFAASALALCIMARRSNIIILPFFLAWILVEDRSSPKQRRADVVVAFITVMVLLMLWSLKNYAFGVNPDRSIGLHMFLIGNTYDSTGIFYYSPSSAAEIFTASGGSYPLGLWYLTKAILHHPAEWLWVEVRKFAAFWIGFEPANNVSYYLSKDFSSLLHLPLPSFNIVSGLGSLGMITSFRHRRNLAFPYLMTVGAFLSVFTFIILSRYRLIIVPLLILFSGLALELVWLRLSSRRYKSAAYLTAAGIAMLLLTRSANIRLLYPDSYLRYFDSMARHNAAIAFISTGNSLEGEIQLKKLLESDPNFSQAYVSYAFLRNSQGRKEEALEILDQGLSISPSDKTLSITRHYIESSKAE